MSFIEHWEVVINCIHFKISNGFLEGFNSIFQAAKAKARSKQLYTCVRENSTLVKLISIILPS
ncbi:MAG: transposase [Bacteroidetes bacterium]|nr:transposase [Bacteroidota bacterium]